MVLQEKESTLLELRVFGPVEARVEGANITQLLSRKALWLLAILALREGKPIERQRLAGMVWPDSSDAGALHNLRQTLATLRRVMGNARICIGTLSPRSIFLRPSCDVRVDALEFDDACADGSPTALERAIELYREPLLTGCDEPFVETWREDRVALFLQAADRLGAHYLSQRKYARAAGIFRRALAEDPYREATCRSLMASLNELSEAPAALEVCREFRQRLRRDLNTELQPETKKLYRNIRTGATRSSQEDLATSKLHQLPNHLTELIGREAEIRDVISLLNRCRLVTLTGAGGVGKTRLATAVAEEYGSQFLDGAWFVDLAPLQNPSTIPTTIAGAMEIQQETGQPILETVCDRLKGRELLILLDNCEHLAPSVAEVVDALLSSAKGVHILATSRQSIGVTGEQVWRVPSLQIPLVSDGGAGRAEHAESIKKSASVRLFLERSGLDITQCPQGGAELDAVASICRRLDGLPLAIELAASRTKALTAMEIEARLSDRFAVLSSSNRTVARHQTLHASMEWSWDLLSEAERELLMRLAVFRGGCSLDTAEAIYSDHPEVPVVECISSLVDRSLVVATRDADGSRFALLETIRQFSEQKLKERGDWERVSDMHRDYFAEMASEGKKKMHVEGELGVFKRFEKEHDNFRAAIAWSHTRGQHEKALSIAVNLARFWDTHGHVSEGLEQLETGLTYAKANWSTRLLSAAHTHAGWMATVQRDTRGALLHYEQSVPIWRKDDDLLSLGTALTCLGCAYQHVPDFLAAETNFREALDLFTALDIKGGVATNLANLGEIAMQQGQLGKARDYLEQSLRVRQGIATSPEPLGELLCLLAIADLREGKLVEARKRAVEAIRLFSGASLVVQVPAAIEHLGVVEAGLESWDRAAKLLGACEGLASVKGAPLSVLLAPDHVAALDSVRAKLGAVAFEASFAAGKTMSIDDAVGLALS
jgi:predicted ATPase/DNA-binding SARP family transcriptional activator